MAAVMAVAAIVAVLGLRHGAQQEVSASPADTADTASPDLASTGDPDDSVPGPEGTGRPWR
jgi:hypothetical protein